MVLRLRFAGEEHHALRCSATVRQALFRVRWRSSNALWNLTSYSFGWQELLDEEAGGGDRERLNSPVDSHTLE